MIPPMIPPMIPDRNTGPAAHDLSGVPSDPPSDPKIFRFSLGRIGTGYRIDK